MIERVIKSVKIFYVVGFLLFALPYSREIFLFLNPLAIPILTAAILWLHKDHNRKSVTAMVAIVVISFLYEMVGVNGSVIFGEYNYGSSMGLKIWNTPPAIGIHWLFLIYCTSGIASMITTKRVTHIITASALMVIYDLLLEAVAPVMKMWSFSEGYPPLANFRGWFILSLILHSIFTLSGLVAEKRVSLIMLVWQSIFLGAILIYTSL